MLMGYGLSLVKTFSILVPSLFVITSYLVAGWILVYVGNDEYDDDYIEESGEKICISASH